MARTGVSLEMPPGCYDRVADRSGIAVKHHLSVGAGVIDPDYRGEVLVVLRNFSGRPYTVEARTRIAQLVFEVFDCPKLEIVAELTTTERQKNGFGSTGMSQDEMTKPVLLEAQSS